MNNPPITEELLRELRGTVLGVHLEVGLENAIKIGEIPEPTKASVQELSGLVKAVELGLFANTETTLQTAQIMRIIGLWLLNSSDQEEHQHIAHWMIRAAGDQVNKVSFDRYPKG